MIKDCVVAHSSDLHVDIEAADSRQGHDGTQNLKLVIDAARRASADILLLAGDTFDSHRQPSHLIAVAATLISNCGMQVVLLPGNHDPIIQDSVYGNLLAGNGAVKNLHVLGVTHQTVVGFDNFGLEIWGKAHTGFEDMDPLPNGLEISASRNILMAHGHYEENVDLTARHRPSWILDSLTLDRSKVAYVALGHWNRAAQVGPSHLSAYYSGSPDYAGTINLVKFKGGNAIVVSQVLV